VRAICLSTQHRRWAVRGRAGQVRLSVPTCWPPRHLRQAICSRIAPLHFHVAARSTTIASQGRPAGSTSDLAALPAVLRSVTSRRGGRPRHRLRGSRTPRPPPLLAAELRPTMWWPPCAMLRAPRHPPAPPGERERRVRSPAIFTCCDSTCSVRPGQWRGAAAERGRTTDCAQLARHPSHRGGARPARRPPQGAGTTRSSSSTTPLSAFRSANLTLHRREPRTPLRDSANRSPASWRLRPARDPRELRTLRRPCRTTTPTSRVRSAPDPGD